MKNLIIKIILFLWQFPQNILGLIVYAVNIKSIKKIYDSSLNVWYFTGKHINNKGVSLGHFIFLDSDSCLTLDRIRHERGHQKQSLYLGWLYLFAIGLPSATGNILHRFIDFDYYAQPWEKWADKLGGVNRDSSKEERNVLGRFC